VALPSHPLAKAALGQTSSTASSSSLCADPVLIQSKPGASREPHGDRKEPDQVPVLARRVRSTLKDQSLSEENLVAAYQSRYERSLVHDLLKACEIADEDVELIHVPGRKQPLLHLTVQGLARSRVDDDSGDAPKVPAPRPLTSEPTFYLLVKALEHSLGGSLCNAATLLPTGLDIGLHLVWQHSNWRYVVPYESASSYARVADALGLVTMTTDPDSPKDWTVVPTERLMLLRLLGELHVAQGAPSKISVTPAQFVNALLPVNTEQAQRDQTMLRFAFGFDSVDFKYDGLTCLAELSSKGKEMISRFMTI